MVAPAIIGAGISAAGGLLGAMMQGKQAKQQNAIAALNYYEQVRANKAREALGREQFELTKAPVISGTGTRSEYIPGKGFVTTLSPMERTISEANLSRMIKEGPGEQARRDYESSKGFDRRLEAGGLLDKELKGFDDEPVQSKRSILGALRLQGRGANEAAMKPAIDAAAAKMLATGDIGAGRAYSDLLSQLAQANRQSQPTMLDAEQIASGTEQQHKASQSNIIQLLAGLAGPNAGRAGPIPIPQDQTTAVMQRLMPQSAGLAASTIQAARHDPLAVSFGASNFLNSAASALFGYDEKQQAAREREQLIKALSGRQLGNSVSQGAGNPGR